MRHLLACLAMLAAFNGGAQSMPYNPDANDDGYIGAPDLLSLLPLYGTQVGIDSSLTCDFIPSSSEEWLIGAITGEVIIDSILWQWGGVDTLSYYVIGCPDPVVDVAILERVLMIIPSQFTVSPGADQVAWYESLPDGTYVTFAIWWSETSNSYGVQLTDNFGSTIYPTGCWPYSYYVQMSLPFGDAFVIDEGGIQNVEGHIQGCIPTQFFAQIIPYWHYAE